MSRIAKTPPSKLSASLLTNDQQAAIDRLYNHDETILVAGMGAGKTIIALSALTELINEGILHKVLILAPLKVAKNVWQQEAQKWEHTKELFIEFCTGTPAEREEQIRSFTRGVMVINFDIMQWFFDTFKKNHGFDGLLVDELSKLKAGGKGFKRMRPHIDTFKWRVGLTGTPVNEDFEGLFYQVYATDNGRRLGRNKGMFLMQHFNQADWQGYSWELQPDGAERIVQLIADLIYTVPDYRHELPPITQHLIKCEMPDSARLVYTALSTHGVVETELGIQTAENAAVLSGKLEQIASGQLYCRDEYDEYVGLLDIHTTKIDTCIDLVGVINRRVIICYWYKHELDRLKKAFPDAVNLNDDGAMARWNAGNVEILLLQPMSASHGIQLEQGGADMIYLKPVWSNDMREQCDARIWRKGQTLPVNIYEIVTGGTVDEMIVDRVNGKKQFDTLFHKLIKAS